MDKDTNDAIAYLFNEFIKLEEKVCEQEETISILSDLLADVIKELRSEDN